MERCIGCGVQLAGSEECCAACSTPSRGHAFNERLAIPDGAIRIPEVCGCCLAPRAITRRFTLSGAAKVDTRHGHHQTVLRIPVPWCRSCRLRSHTLFVIPFLVFFLGSFPAIYMVSTIRGGDIDGTWAFVGIAIAGIGALTVHAILNALSPLRRGHVARCVAYENGGIDESGAAQVIFANRAFARIWSEANR